jgi:hypothetical protein
MGQSMQLRLATLVATAVGFDLRRAMWLRRRLRPMARRAKAHQPSSTERRVELQGSQHGKVLVPWTRLIRLLLMRARLLEIGA